MTGGGTWLVMLTAVVGVFLLWALGANDVANALGTSVGSGALSMRSAIVLGVTFEILGASLVGGSVSTTIGTSLVDPTTIASAQHFMLLMFSALLGSALWISACTQLSMPVSSTHAIIGSVIFAAVSDTQDPRMASGVHWGVVGKIAASWFLSPAAGFVLAYVTHVLVNHTILDRAADVSTVELSETTNMWEAAFVGPGGGLVPGWVPATAGASAASVVIFVLVGGPARVRVHLSFPGYALVFVSSTLLGASVVYAVSAWQSRIVKRRNAVLLYNMHTVQEDEGSHDDEGPSERDALKAGEISELAVAPESSVTSGECPHPFDRFFLVPMVISACAMAFAHGGNDVANAVGPFSMVLKIATDPKLESSDRIPKNYLESTETPLVVCFAGGMAISLGLATNGARVMETIGTNITRLSLSKGWAAQNAAATSVLFATVLGLPISSSCVLVGAVMGVGMTSGENPNWAIFGKIVATWVATLPAAGLVSAIVYQLAKLLV